LSKPFYILCLVGLTALLVVNITEEDVTVSQVVTLLLWIACFATPLMLVLWMALTVTLKKKNPYLITFNAVVVGTMTNALLLMGMLALVSLAWGEKPLKYVPAYVTWSMSFGACTLGYWWFLGRLPNEKAAILSGKHDYSLFRKKDPATIAKRIPDGLNTRNALYIALFMSALQQPYYYLVYTIASSYDIKSPLAP